MQESKWQNMVLYAQHNSIYYAVYAFKIFTRKQCIQEKSYQNRVFNMNNILSRVFCQIIFVIQYTYTNF